MGSTHVNVSSTPPSASVLQSEIDGGPLYQRHPPDRSCFVLSSRRKHLQKPTIHQADVTVTNNQSRAAMHVASFRGTVTDNY